MAGQKVTIEGVIDEIHGEDAIVILEINDEDILVNRIEELSLGFTPNLSIQVLF